MNTAKREAQPLDKKEVMTLEIQNGSIEALKWIAIISMTIDHINSFLLPTLTGQAYPVLTYIGRIAFPLFAFVIAYNLARPRSSCGEEKAITSAIKRLLLFGVISTLPYYEVANQRILPLNIMFTLALAAIIILIIKKGTLKQGRAARYMMYIAAHAVFIFGSILVEYGFHGVALIVTAWLFFRFSSAIALVLVVIITFTMLFINESHYALLALPIFAASYFVNVKLPRAPQYVFYAYYPLHLTAIYLAISIYRGFFS